MWNSNSVIAWLIARSGIDAKAIRPPAMGRAPGWLAGLVAAQRPDGEIARSMPALDQTRLAVVQAEAES
jgi:hypothetical protein